MIELLLGIFIFSIAYKLYKQSGNGLKFILFSFVISFSMHFGIIAINNLVFNYPFLELYSEIMLLIIVLLTAVYLWSKYE